MAPWVETHIFSEVNLPVVIKKPIRAREAKVAIMAIHENPVRGILRALLLCAGWQDFAICHGAIISAGKSRGREGVFYPVP